MRAIGVLVAVAAMTTKACASALTSMAASYGTNFGEIRSDRPGVADARKGGQTAITGFAKPAHISAGYPLPAQANPHAMFSVPTEKHHAANRAAGPCHPSAKRRQ